MSCEITKLICENTKLICENTKLICEITKLICENTKLICENSKYFTKVEVSLLGFHRLQMWDERTGFLQKLPYFAESTFTTMISFSARIRFQI